jgi:hypothetical protein
MHLDTARRSEQKYTEGRLHENRPIAFIWVDRDIVSPFAVYRYRMYKMLMEMIREF